MAALNLSHELLQSKSGVVGSVGIAADKADLQRLNEKLDRALSSI
jgi:hypothetical protein